MLGLVSRSRHTDPRAIRAARRIAEPRGPRGEDDPSLRRRQAQRIKEGAGAPDPVIGRTPSGPARPRVIEHGARPGFHHPVSRNDVLAILEPIAPEAIYGLRSIALGRGPQRRGLSSFGRLCVPGQILLYDLPVPPWHLSGMIAAHDAALLAKAGAVVTVHGDVGVTVVDWPGDTLRQFVLFEVLLHEIGHHILQHHKGKPRARVARTRDHEAFADRFAAKCRLA